MAPARHAAFLEDANQRIRTHRASLRILSRSSTARAVLGITADWLLIAASILLSEQFPTWWGYALAVLVISSRMNALSLDWLHEAQHGNLFRGKVLYALFDCFYGYPIFLARKLGLEEHLAHHASYLTEAEGVPLSGYDYYYIDERRWSSRSYRVWIWLVRPLLGYATGIFLRNTLFYLRQDARESCKIAAFWIVVCGLLAWAQALPLLWWYWLLPLMLVHPLFLFWVDLMQHFNTHHSPSRDVRGPLLRLLFTPHGRTAYHNLHHLLPRIPWFNLRRASALCVDEARIDRAGSFLELSLQVTSARVAW